MNMRTSLGLVLSFIAGLTCGAIGNESQAAAVNGVGSAVVGPAYDGTHATVSQMRYLPTGEVSATASALAIARNPSTPAMTTYTYYADTAFDLSGTTKAGGWLEAGKTGMVKVAP